MRFPPLTRNARIGFMGNVSKISLMLPAGFDSVGFCGPADVNIRQLEQSFKVRLGVAADHIELFGDSYDVECAALVVGDMVKRASSGALVDDSYLRRAIVSAKNSDLMPEKLRSDVILTHRGKTVHPKTAGQKRYVDAIRTHTVTFATGAAGTGKTYLAVACALAALNAKQVGRIVLSRPVVEAGENLGFLPGTLMEKVDPYMRPLYDALYAMEDFERVNQLIAENIIEIAPLAFMRGRTLSDSFIILDEAQNATPEQMKMFLTRLGFGSKMVITGDDTQTDLAHGKSGFADMPRILGGVKDIAFCKFDGADVVRHPLVGDIVAAYERAAAEPRRR